MMRFRHHAILTVLALSACAPRSSGPVSTQAQYLYLWTASDDVTQPDFLAVLDVTEDGSRYEGMRHRAVIARFDPATGRLSVDERFREEGATEPGFPHGQQDVAPRRRGQGHSARRGVQSAVI